MSGDVVVRATAAFSTNDARIGRYKVLTGPRHWRTGFISRADVADFLVKQIADDTCLRQAPVLIG